MLVVISVTVWLQSGILTSRFLTMAYIGIFRVACRLRPLLALPRPPAVKIVPAFQLAAKAKR
jgi:hypothetical protein